MVLVVSGIIVAPAGFADNAGGSVYLGNKIVADGKVTTAGITPDSPLWPLDVAVKRLSLLLTLDDSAKAHGALQIARERLLEVREMIMQNKLDAAAKAEEEHKVMLKTASDSS